VAIHLRILRIKWKGFSVFELTVKKLTLFFRCCAKPFVSTEILSTRRWKRFSKGFRKKNHECERAQLLGDASMKVMKNSVAKKR
jgi:hypothetical protein